MIVLEGDISGLGFLAAPSSSSSRLSSSSWFRVTAPLATNFSMRPLPFASDSEPVFKDFEADTDGLLERTTPLLESFFLTSSTRRAATATEADSRRRVDYWKQRRVYWRRVYTNPRSYRYLQLC